MAFGSGGLYMTRIQDTATQSSLYITATDDVTANSNIVLAPKGTVRSELLVNLLLVMDLLS